MNMLKVKTVSFFDMTIEGRVVVTDNNHPQVLTQVMYGNDISTEAVYEDVNDCKSVYLTVNSYSVTHSTVNSY